jgi:hypothetical protein
MSIVRSETVTTYGTVKTQMKVNTAVIGTRVILVIPKLFAHFWYRYLFIRFTELILAPY